MSFGLGGMAGQRRWSRGLLVSLSVGAFGLYGRPALAQLAGGANVDDPSFSANGSLRDSVSSLVQGGSNTTVRTGLPWTFSGDVDVSVGVTDNAGGVNTSWQPFVLISPDFALNGQTSRLDVALEYSPRLAWYPSSSGQTLLSHTFNGNATLTVVPDWLFLNVRGVTALTSRFGDTSPYYGSFITSGDAVQTSSFGVSPYLQHTFADIGTLTVTYNYAATFQDSPYGNFPTAVGANNSAGFGTIGNLQTSTESASFVTGPRFGRIQNSTTVSASQNYGDPFYNGSTTLSADNTVSYALYRWLTLLASVGYEEYNYPSGFYHLSDVTWKVGFTLIPNADSSITIEYGRKAGIETILANGTYAPTARTRLYGSYNVDIQTGLGARQSLLGSTLVGPGGLLIDARTGQPVYANNYLASQFSLSRLKTLTVGGALLLDRDSFTASVSHARAQQLVNSTDVFGVTTPPGTSTDTTYATLGWQHDLNPSTSLISSITYGISNNGVYYGVGGGNQDTWELFTGLNHTFTDTLSGHVSYSHGERLGSAVRNFPTTFGGPSSQNTLLVGLRKSF